MTKRLTLRQKVQRMWKGDTEKHTAPPTVVQTHVEPPTLREELHRLLAVEISKVAADNDYETEEEANDFDIPESDFLYPMTAYEIEAMEDYTEYAPERQINRSLADDQEDTGTTPPVTPEANAGEATEAPDVDTQPTAPPGS